MKKAAHYAANTTKISNALETQEKGLKDTQTESATINLTALILQKSNI